MKLLHDETRKLRSFREMYMGILLAIVLHMFAMYSSAIGDENWIIGNWNSWFQDILSEGLCAAIFIILGVSRLFCYENERGCEFIVGSTKKGKSKTYLSKILLVVILCFAIVLLLGVTRFLVEYIWGSIEGALDPVTGCTYYSNGGIDNQLQDDGSFIPVIVEGGQPPYSNIVYLLIQHAFLFLGLLYFAGFIIIIALLTRKTALTTVLSGIFVVISLYYNTFGSNPLPENPICEYLYRFGPGGNIFYDSFAWTKYWCDTWKAVVVCIIGILAEAIIIWLSWKRRARK